MTPREALRAVTAARKREWRQGLPAAYLAATVAAVFSEKGGPKPPTVEDFLGPNPYEGEAGAARAAAEEARLAAYRRAQANARETARIKRERRERERQPHGAVPDGDGAGAP